MSHLGPIREGAVVTGDIILWKPWFHGILWNQRDPVDSRVGLVRSRRSCTELSWNRRGDVGKMFGGHGSSRRWLWLAAVAKGWMVSACILSWISSVVSGTEGTTGDSWRSVNLDEVGSGSWRCEKSAKGMEGSSGASEDVGICS